MNELMNYISNYSKSFFGSGETGLITRQRHRKTFEEVADALNRVCNEGASGREEVIAATEVPVEQDRALAYVKALGGAANIVSLDACTTRLRLVVKDQSVVDAEGLRRLGARGLVKPSANSLQVVVGTEADQVAGEMKDALRTGKGPSMAALLAALGGRSNVRAVELASTRLRINIADASIIDEPAITVGSLGSRAARWLVSSRNRPARVEK